MENSDIKGFIFDYGGTIDCGGDHWAVHIRRAFDEVGVHLTLEQFIDAYVAVERLLARQRYILPEHTFLDMMRIKAQLETERLVTVGAIAADRAGEVAEAVAQSCYNRARACAHEAVGVLDYLSERYALELVSNFYGNIESVLTDFGLRSYFPHIIESAVVGVRKPDARIFALGVEALGLKPQQTVVVGDSVSKDIIPAASLGCRTVWIEGAPWFGESVSRPDCTTIRSLDELKMLY